YLLRLWESYLHCQAYPCRNSVSFSGVIFVFPSKLNLFKTNPAQLKSSIFICNFLLKLILKTKPCTHTRFPGVRRDAAKIFRSCIRSLIKSRELRGSWNQWLAKLGSL